MRIRTENAFTLIEILISFSVILLISTTTFLTFIRFNKQQVLNVSYDNLRNSLNEVRSSAASQISSKCTTSQTLVGYQMAFDTSSPTYSYTLGAVCSQGGAESVVTVHPAVVLPTGITLSTSPANMSPVVFLVLSQGIRNPGTITISNGIKSRTININAAGVIQ